MKKDKVNYNASSIFDIDINFFVSLKIKAVICDLDNTLDRFDVLRPNSRVIELKDNLEKNGIELMIVSNNHGPRVKSYSMVLGVKYLANARKPFTKRFKKFLTDQKLSIDDVVFVGDQLLTDAKLARKCNVKFILTEPVYKKEQWTTYFNRLIDRPLRKMYRKQNRLGHRCPLNTK